MDKNTNPHRQFHPPHNMIPPIKGPPHGPMKEPPPYLGIQRFPSAQIPSSKNMQQPMSDKSNMSQNYNAERSTILSTHLSGNRSSNLLINGHPLQTSTEISESSNKSFERNSPASYVSQSQPNSGNTSRQSPNSLTNLYSDENSVSNSSNFNVNKRSLMDYANSHNKLNGKDSSDTSANLGKQNIMSNFSKSDSNILNSIESTSISSNLSEQKHTDNFFKSQNENCMTGSESNLINKLSSDTSPNLLPVMPTLSIDKTVQISHTSNTENFNDKVPQVTSALKQTLQSPTVFSSSSLNNAVVNPSISFPHSTLSDSSHTAATSVQHHQTLGSVMYDGKLDIALSGLVAETSKINFGTSLHPSESTSTTSSHNLFRSSPSPLESTPSTELHQHQSALRTDSTSLRSTPSSLGSVFTTNAQITSLGSSISIGPRLTTENLQTMTGGPPATAMTSFSSVRTSPPSSIGSPLSLIQSSVGPSLPMRPPSSIRLPSSVGPPLSVGPPVSSRPPLSSVRPHSMPFMPPITSVGASPVLMGPSLMSGPPLAPPAMMMRQPQSSFGPSPVSMVAQQSFVSTPPTAMRPPPSSIGAPHTLIAAPPATLGPPPMSVGLPPTSIGPPPTSLVGPSPTSMGHQTTSSGQSAASSGPSMRMNSMRHPSTMGPPGISSSFVTQQQPLSQSNVNQVSRQLGGLSVTKDGWNKGWGTSVFDLLQQKCVVPPNGVVPPKLVLSQDYLPNCSPDVFRCTLTKLPETQSVLQKSRLPFGILIHPFKDLEHLAVVSCNTIVRCRSCRTYINPFVIFKGDRRWECNLCYRVNEIPDEFLFDPMSRTYGDPSRRPEVREATIEFIAPQEYMLRPPQPAAYVYVLDVSRQAIETGYLKIFCETLLAHLDKIPGDRRTLIGFITYSTTVQFYLMGEGQKNVQMLEIGEINDMFIPSPDDLMVNLEESRCLIEDLLLSLPDTHANTCHTQAALGAALTAAYKLVSPIGGRITVMAITLPTIGPGSLKSREDPNQRSAKDISHLGPATDFYKKLALDCSGQQIAVDLFTLNSQYIDLATLSGMSKFSGGSIHHFPGFHTLKSSQTVLPFKSCLVRYLTRKIGFEAVMRIRATRGLAITNFHGNFFVRSTDLLSLPNINPDAGFGMQVSLEEPLHNIRQACFQAALLYTSSKGERRIRVHTLCLPVTPNIHEIINGGDQQAIVSLLAKMAVDKCLSAQMSDAREAIVNACCDALSAYKASLSSCSGLPAPPSLQMLPLYLLALLKSVALRHGLSTKLDDRLFAMCELKSLPLCHLIQTVYPDLYPIHNLTEKGAISVEDMVVPQPGRLHLSAEYIDRNGAYLLDTTSIIYVYIRSGISSQWVNEVIGVPSFAAIPQPLYEETLPFIDNVTSELVRNFVMYLQKNKPFPVPIHIIREDNPSRILFINCLADDRSEGAHSYVEFLQFVKSQIK